MAPTTVREAVIVDCARSAFGKRKGALGGWHPTDLLGLVLRNLVERNDIDPARIDDVVGGCVTQAGEQGCNVTRNAWVAAGLPWSVPATSVDRQCGSSQQAVHFVAQGVIAGAYDIAIACGVESMTRAPMSSNARGGTGPFSPDFLANTNNTLGIQFWVAQVLADKWGITREEMDAYALQSHRRAAENTDNGFFADEIVPVPKKDAETGALTGETLEHDEGIRRNASLDALAALPAAWESTDQPAPDITAGNSSQMTDGAGAMLIADAGFAERNGLPVRARLKHFAVAAEDPVLVLSAPVPVTYKLMDRTGMKVDDFDAVECNEAFAAIALMWQKEFGYPMERFNPRGGAIALGHPLGASGVSLMTRLLRHLEATGGRIGFQTMCEGGGQANATVLEVV
jgi:acetyl-CoA acetyltransferase family protein